MKIFKELALWLAALAAFIGLIWILAFNNLAMFKVFKPASEAVRRETFEETKSYQDGKAQELLAMQMEYIQASPAHKAALATVIKQRAVGARNLPENLNTFLKELP